MTFLALTIFYLIPKLLDSSSVEASDRIKSSSKFEFVASENTDPILNKS